MSKANFRALCSGAKGFGYEKSRFHYVVPLYVVQGGDITNHNVTGGKSIYGEVFDDENFIHKHPKAGILSMTNRGPNTNNSQFFITGAATPSLDGRHVVFGEVVDGMNVVRLIEYYGQSSGIPRAEITITKCGILQ